MLFSGWTLRTFPSAPLGSSRIVIDGQENLHYGAGYLMSGPFESVQIARATHIPTAFVNFGLEAAATGIAIDSNGNLFYSCFYGGDGPPLSGAGIIVEQRAGTGQPQLLATMPGGALTWPSGDPVVDAHGNLFGVTLLGAIYELPHGSSTLNTLYTFSDNADNGSDLDGLFAAPNGILYGTAASGGIGGPNSNNGTVFQFNPTTGAFSTLVRFNGANGADPNDGMVMNSAGDLFGTTQLGGAHNQGTIFEIVHGSHDFKTLASFNGTNGSAPISGLIIDRFGNLYGDTSNGGAAGNGTIYEIPQGTNSLVTLTDFAGQGASAAAHPRLGLAMDTAGNLYGADPGVFELSPPATLITSYLLINADTGKAIETLQNGATINLAQLPADLNVVVQIQGMSPGSVLIGLDNRPRYALSATSPYSLFGFRNGKYLHGTFAAGRHTLSSQAWQTPNASILLDRGPTITFTVIDQA